ncbi:MAG: hypothetical protein QW741_03610 [Sulfolobales archaeon]
METREPVVLTVYRLNLGVGTKEFIREVYRLATEAGPSGISMLLLPLKPLKDLLAGRKSYGSYKRAVRVLMNKVSAVVTSERTYVGPVVMRYGENTYLSIVEAASGTEVSRKFMRLGEDFKGYVPKSPTVVVRGTNICFLVYDDIFHPEVARYCVESGSTTLISVVPPITEVDPDLVVLAARMRAYENSVNVIVVGGYVKDRSTPTVVVKRDGSVVDIVNDARSEVLEIELAGDTASRVSNELVRKYYARIIKTLNSYSASRFL